MIFTFPLPPTTNSSYRTTKTGGFYTTQKHKDWFTEAGWISKKEYKGKPIKDEVVVDITLYLKTDRDIDGSVKPILDLLQRQGVYVNDSQVVELSVAKETDKAHPRVVVLCCRLAEDRPFYEDLCTRK